MQPEEKPCSKCNDTKDAAEFLKDSSKKTGLSSQCKQCIKEAEKERQ